jgi:hypothetical protein
MQSVHQLLKQWTHPGEQLIHAVPAVEHSPSPASTQAAALWGLLTW